MARVLTDIVRPEIRRAAREARQARATADQTKGRAASASAEAAECPTSITVFYDGGSPAILRRAARYRRLFCRGLGDGPADILWRDLRRFPFALLGWHVGPEDWRGRLYVVDRCAALRAGLEARRLLRREIRTCGRRGLARALYARAPFALHGRFCSRLCSRLKSGHGPGRGRPAF